MRTDFFYLITILTQDKNARLIGPKLPENDESSKSCESHLNLKESTVNIPEPSHRGDLFSDNYTL